MKRILLASVAALGLAGTASAADLAVKAPVVYAPVFTWTGCYLGINGGWIGGNDSYTTYNVFDGLNVDNQSFSPGDSAGTAGGQFGCQVQLGSWVIGGEWDWNWTGLQEETSLNYLSNFFADTQINQWTNKDLNWFSTARVKLGLAWDRVLVYATGGFAYARYDANTRIDWDVVNAGAFYFGGYAEKRIGYTVGGGLEWAFANNWTAKAEFLYLDFGSFDYQSVCISGNTDCGAVDHWHSNVDAKEYVARIGINYLFHTGGAPVVAKY